MGRGTHTHMTCWVPYGDISTTLGGLMVLEGSHKRMDLLENYVFRDVDAFCENKPKEADAAKSGKWAFTGTLSHNPPVIRNKFGGRWLTTEFKAGDFITFGMFLVHASLDNRTTNQLRISSDAPLPASQRADRRALDRREPARPHHRRQARSDLLKQPSHRSNRTYRSYQSSTTPIMVASSTPRRHPPLPLPPPAAWPPSRTWPGCSASSSKSSASSSVPRPPSSTASASPELKYLLCQHVWESASHARFLRERGRELSGFGASESVRPTLRRLFNEAVMPADAYVALAGFYRVLKPALLIAYRHYLQATHHLADWPSLRLVEEFIHDEERHAKEILPYLGTADDAAWAAHLGSALLAEGGLLGEAPALPLPAGFTWESEARAYRHPDTCNRGKYPTCSSVFSYDPDETPIVRPVARRPEDRRPRRPPHGLCVADDGDGCRRLSRHRVLRHARGAVRPAP